MNSFVNFGLSMHLADCHSVTMPALLPHVVLFFARISEFENYSFVMMTTAGAVERIGRIGMLKHAPCG